MYIDIENVIEIESHTSMISNNIYHLYWEGIVFYKGMQEGRESMEVLLSKLKPRSDTNTIINNIKDLRGNWCIFLYEPSLNRWIICSDHSHQNNIFYTQNSVSSSFLRLRSKMTDKRLVNEESLLLFLYSGYCYTKSIFYSEIRKLDYHYIIELSRSKIIVRSKELPNQFLKMRPANFVSTLGLLFSSLRNHKMCIDLTGGTDSRALLIALYHHGFNFDVATYGDHLYSEVQIAQKIANLVEKKLKFKDLTPNEMSSDDLLLAWKACDGLDLDIDSYKFEQWRAKFDYTLVISSTAGELYKDGGWYIDAIRSGLAFKGHAGLIRSLFETHKILWSGMSIYELQSLLRDKHVENIKQQISEISHKLLINYINFPLLEASDRIFFDFSLNRPGGTNNSIINRFMPLYEPEMINIGINQSIWKRLNHNLYRQQCGRLNRRVANIESDRLGLTLSPNYIEILKEYSKYINTYISIKLRHDLPSFKTQNNNKKTTAYYILNHPDLDKGIINLKDRGYLNDKLIKTALSPTIACRIVALNYLLDT